MGVEDWFPQRPHFLHLCQFLQFLRTALTSRGNELPYPRIQYLLMDAVGGTIGFAVPVIAFADISVDFRRFLRLYASAAYYMGKYSRPL